MSRKDRCLGRLAVLTECQKQLERKQAENAVSLKEMTLLARKEGATQLEIAEARQISRQRVGQLLN